MSKRPGRSLAIRTNIHLEILEDRHLWSAGPFLPGFPHPFSLQPLYASVPGSTLPTKPAPGPALDLNADYLAPVRPPAAEDNAGFRMNAPANHVPGGELSPPGEGGGFQAESYFGSTKGRVAPGDGPGPAVARDLSRPPGGDPKFERAGPEMIQLENGSSYDSTGVALRDAKRPEHPGPVNATLSADLYFLWRDAKRASYLQASALAENHDLNGMQGSARAGQGDAQAWQLFLSNRQLLPLAPAQSGISDGSETWAASVILPPGTRSTTTEGAIRVGEAGELLDAASAPSAGAADLLTDLRPFNCAALEQAAQQLASQLDQLGGELASLLTAGLFPWVIGGVIAATAYEVARKRQQGRIGSSLALVSEEFPFTFPDLAEPTFEEEQ
jgi:hypothetical protein